MSELKKKSLETAKKISELIGFDIIKYCSNGSRPLSYFDIDIYDMKKDGINIDNFKRNIERIANDYKKFKVSENGGFGLAIVFIK